MSLSGHLRCMLLTQDVQYIVKFEDNWELPGKLNTLSLQNSLVEIVCTFIEDRVYLGLKYK